MILKQTKKQTNEFMSPDNVHMKPAVVAWNIVSKTEQFMKLY